MSGRIEISQNAFSSLYGSRQNGEVKRLNSDQIDRLTRTEEAVQASQIV